MYELIRRVFTQAVLLLSLFAVAPVHAANPQFVEEVMGAIFVEGVELLPPSARLTAILKKYGEEDNITVYSTRSTEAPAYATASYIAINETAFPSDVLLTYVVLHEIGHIRHSHALRKSLIVVDYAELNNVHSVGAFIDQGYTSSLPSEFYDYSRKTEFEADKYAFDKLEQYNELKLSYKTVISFLLPADVNANADPKATHPPGYQRAKKLTDRLLGSL